MKMDRNLNEDGLGKYALINLRRLSLQGRTPEVENALRVLQEAGVLEQGRVGDEDEFFGYPDLSVFPTTETAPVTLA